MKTTFQTGRPACRGDSQIPFGLKLPKFPLVEWGLHAAAPLFRGSAGAGSCANKRASFRAFRALGNSYFDAEARLHDGIDAAIFALMVTICAWPIALAARAAWHLMK
jgi:hypothetical protein